MKVDIEELSPIKKKLKFEVPQEDYQKALEKAYAKLGKSVQIKGFRKGKVPRTVLEKYYGARTSMETVSDLVDKSYREAIQEHSILAVGLPNISDLKVEEKEPISFVAEVEVQPKVRAKHFEGIKLKKNKIKVSDEEVDQELKSIQKGHAQWIPVEEGVPAVEGNVATVNYSGSVDGKPFEGGAANNVEVPLGLNRFLPDFEKGILGLSKGQKSEFDVQFPEDYGVKTLKGKAARFEVEVLEIKREELPALDDEFAKDLGTYDSLAQVKDEIRDKIAQGKEAQERGELFKQVMEHLIKKNSFDIPQGMIDREIDFMWKTVLNQIQQQNLTPEQVGIKEEDYRSKNRDEAIKRIKGFLLFDSIAAEQKLEVAEAELDAKLNEVAQRHRQPLESVKQYYEQKNLIRPLFNQILEEKTLEFIISKAKISEK